MKFFITIFYLLFLSKITLAETSADYTGGKQSILCITNLSSKIQKAQLNKAYYIWNNLIGPKVEIKNKFLILKPFETIWLSNK